MSARRDVLERIAAALERMVPAGAARVDWRGAPAFVWNGADARTIATLDTVPLAQLVGIDAQREAVKTNIARLARGVAAHDMLLWGARGMGKSALIRSAVADIQGSAQNTLALVQVTPEAVPHVPDLLAQLSGQPGAFLLFFDDLGFGAQDGHGNLALRSLLDGGLEPRPANVRLAVTSNRRAIVQRGEHEAEALHVRDERDNALALADRFGLILGFHPCDQATYLAILRAYTDPLGLVVDEEEALAWAIARGNRSGRTAYQFACELAGRAGLALLR